MTANFKRILTYLLCSDKYCKRLYRLIVVAVCMTAGHGGDIPGWDCNPAAELGRAAVSRHGRDHQG